MSPVFPLSRTATVAALYIPFVVAFAGVSDTFSQRNSKYMIYPHMKATKNTSVGNEICHQIADTTVSREEKSVVLNLLCEPNVQTTDLSGYCHIWG